MKLFALAIALLSQVASFANPTFVNLNKDNVRVATMVYTDGKSGPFKEAGWVFSGWHVIKPGESWKSNSKYAYLELRSGFHIGWKDFPTKPGYVKYESAFAEHLVTGTNPQRLLDKAYQARQFTVFEENRIVAISRVGGQQDAFVMLPKTESFKFESREIGLVSQTFEAPGTIVAFGVDSESRYERNIEWKLIAPNKLKVSGAVAGKRELLGGTTSGLYKGTVKYWYTRPY